MIPYHPLGPWHLGPFTIYPFGILVGLAILVGSWVAQREAERDGVHPGLFQNLVIWIFVGGFAMAHIVSVVFYFPDRLKENPLELVMFWRGISSFGGFLGAILALVIYVKKYRLPMWTTVDAVAYALAVGWIFGRMGCTVAFDHPGKPTNFFLGFQTNMYPHDGYKAVHNLGFYEMLYTVVLATTLTFLRKRKPFVGFNAAFLAIAYAPVRFGLDFLRIADKRYLGLTPGQYFAIGLFLYGLYLVWARRKAPPESFEPYDYKTGKGGILPSSSGKKASGKKALGGKKK